MSQAALLSATKNFIIKNISFNNEDINENLCDVMPDGRPPTGSGEFFISVHPGSWKGSSMEILDVTHSINISLNYKLGAIPHDRIGKARIVQKYTGIEPFSQLLAETFHLNYIHMQEANNIIDDPYNKFVEPLRFQYCSAPRIVDASWFQAKEGVAEGIVIQLTFGDARRVQYGAYQPYYGVIDGKNSLVYPPN